MPTQNTTLSIDRTTLTQAKKQAKRDRISVSAAARILLSDYAMGKVQIGTRTITENGFTPEFEEEVLKSSADAKKGKNIKTFNSVEDFVKDLRKHR